MHIETVAGPIEPEELGGVLMHEHVASAALHGFYTAGSGDLELAVRAIEPLSESGIGTMVDLTGRSRVEAGHDFSVVRELASRLPLHLVAGFSYYKDPWLENAGTSDLDDLTRIYVAMAGAASSGFKPGIYGEIGTSLDAITPGEEAHLRAVARAHGETGLAISTHCTLGTMAPDQVEILLGEGVDPAKVVIGHVDLLPDLAYIEGLLATGVNVAFDTFGKEWFDYRVPGSEDLGPGEFVKWAYRRPDDDRIAVLVELCSRGYDDRIVVSCDMTGAEAWLNPTTHGRHGYAYLPTVVLPRLRAAGVSEEQLHRIVVDNPARILAIS